MSLNYRAYVCNGLRNAAEHGVEFHERVQSFEDFVLGHIALGHIRSYLCDVLCTFRAIRERGAGVYIWAVAHGGTGDYLFPVFPADPMWPLETIIKHVEGADYDRVYVVTIDAIEDNGCSGLWMRNSPRQVHSHTRLGTYIQDALDARAEKRGIDASRVVYIP